MPARRRTVLLRAKAFVGRRYRLRLWACRCARLAASVFPRWAAAGALADRLAFVRSVYGPYLLNTPGDRTFRLCVEGYNGFISGAIAGRDCPFLFLDIGANLGLFSLLAAANPRCERAVAIEPLPAIFARLEANLRRNRAGNVEPVRGAIAAVTAPLVHLTFDRRHSGMARVVAPEAGRVTARALPAAVLDDLLPAAALPILAKIDVEGSEVEVMTVLRQCRFYGAVEEILIEVSERNLGRERRAALLAMLAEDGFVELGRAGPAEHYDARFARRGGHMN